MSDVFKEIDLEVQRGKCDEVRQLVEGALEQGVPAIEILEKGLRSAMEEVGRRFEILEIFLPDVMLAADAMKAGVDVLRPHLGADMGGSGGVVLIGTVEGDVHDIGKNIVAIMLEGAGFTVVDLGYDVPVMTFVERAVEVNPDIVAMSSLMTTTMVHMPRVIKSLTDQGVRAQVKAIVGGAPVLPEWAREIGADGYGENATEAVNIVKELMK